MHHMAVTMMYVQSKFAVYVLMHEEVYTVMPLCGLPLLHLLDQS